MGLQLNKFVHSETGKIIMSILLGFGLASLFRTVCKGKGCLQFYAAPLDEIKDKIYKNANGTGTNSKGCSTFKPTFSKCNLNMKVINFE